MRVLTLVNYYLPGFKSGGPTRSLANLVERLGDEFEFTIVTYDRDIGDPRPYANVSNGVVVRIGKADVIYLSAAEWHFRNLARIIQACRPDVLYVNSFFQAQFGVAPIFLRHFGWLPDVPVILAPRGEFCVGALGLKATKKRAYLALARALGMYRGVTWQASSGFEAAEIRQQIDRANGAGPLTGPHDTVLVVPVVPDLLPPSPKPRHRDGQAKVPGHLRAMFLSRLSPKKNLLGALHMLARIRGRVDFTIYGPVEDRRYWDKCRDAIRMLPANVRVHYAGPVEHTQVADAMLQHDLFFFPTLGENYGHVIAEAMLVGCPVLLSDRTPWRNLTAAGVGWDLPLEQPERFCEVLEECIAMDAPTFNEWSERAMAFALRQATDPDTVEANRQLFRGVIQTRAVQGTAVAGLNSRYDEGAR